MTTDTTTLPTGFICPAPITPDAVNSHGAISEFVNTRLNPILDKIKIDYPVSISFRGRAVLDKGDAWLIPHKTDSGDFVPCLIGTMVVADRDDSSKFVPIMKGFRIAIDLTDDQIKRRVLECAKDMISHEVQENFYFEGQRIFDPHLV